MGNYASCTLAITPLMMKNSRAVRVIFPGGEVRQFRSDSDHAMIKAAELMLDLPNFFVSDSKSLHIGRRFSALAADEELEPGSVYVMFPMRRLNSIVTAADLAAVFMAANSAAKRISGGAVRILSDIDHRRSLESEEEKRLGFDEIVPEFKYRLGTCRSRKPMLETIKEEPIRLR